MELKLFKHGYILIAQGCSNRTFMELKYMLFIQSEYLEEGSNRTFMELKYIKTCKDITKQGF